MNVELKEKEWVNFRTAYFIAVGLPTNFVTTRNGDYALICLYSALQVTDEETTFLAYTRRSSSSFLHSFVKRTLLTPDERSWRRTLRLADVSFNWSGTSEGHSYWQRVDDISRKFHIGEYTASTFPEKASTDIPVKEGVNEC